MSTVTNFYNFSSRYFNEQCMTSRFKLYLLFLYSYGDSSPKSLPGRLFCFIWIITGINIISIFTALVTATVTASTRPYFNIHGAKVYKNYKHYTKPCQVPFKV